MKKNLINCVGFLVQIFVKKIKLIFIKNQDFFSFILKTKYKQEWKGLFYKLLINITWWINVIFEIVNAMFTEERRV